MESSGLISLTSHERVTRILQLAALNKVNVLIRSSSKPELAVNGKISEVLLQADGARLRIGNLSHRGVTHIETNRNQILRVDFVLTSAKLTFESVVISTDTTSAIVSYPKELMSVERRQSVRHAITKDFCVGVRIPELLGKDNETLKPPFFLHHKDLANFLYAGDVSLGGISVVTRFPYALEALKRGHIVDDAEVVFPLAPPIGTVLEVRWQKRVKESVQLSVGRYAAIKTYTFGFKFRNPTRQLEDEIRRVIQRVSTAEAI